MSCGKLQKQVKVKTAIRSRGLRYFDLEKFMSELICASDDGKHFITVQFIDLEAETLTQRLIRKEIQEAYRLK